mgnify:CR=1 FL=1
MFIELVELELDKLYEESDEAFLDLLVDAYGDDVKSLKEDLGLSDEEAHDLMEAMVRRVSSTGEVKRTRTRQVRSRRASITTGRSRADLKRSARKAARTRRKNPAIVKRATRKRKKAIRRRKAMGLN